MMKSGRIGRRWMGKSGVESSNYLYFSYTNCQLQFLCAFKDTRILHTYYKNEHKSVHENVTV